jgi:dihydrofolate reductase
LPVANGLQRGNNVRKIVVSNYVTLDGFFAGPNGEIEWFVWDEETAEYMKGRMSSIDTILFGRVTYELMAGYWPTATPPTEDPVIIDAMRGSGKEETCPSLSKWMITSRYLTKWKKKPARSFS